MASTIQNGKVRHRPGGRTARTTERIHAAVLQLLVNLGHEACTFQNVADRAGIERSTLYRRYPDRWAMIINAFGSLAVAEVAPRLSGSLRGDLKDVLQRFVQLWSSKVAEAMLAMVLAVRGTAAQDSVVRFVNRRLGMFDAIFDAAIARGELPAEIDREEMLERAAGIVIFRILIANRPPDDAWLDRLVGDLIANFAGRPGAARETAS